MKGLSEYHWLVFIVKLLLNSDRAIWHHTDPSERHHGLSIMTLLWQRRQIRHKNATERKGAGEKWSILRFCCFHHFFPVALPLSILNSMDQESGKKKQRSGRWPESWAVWKQMACVAPRSYTGQTGLGPYLVGSVKKEEMMHEVTFGEETLVGKTNPDWFYRH